MTLSKTVTPDDFPSGFLITDIDQNVRYANHYFISKFGIEREELIGRCLIEFLTPASTIFLESYLLPLLLHEHQFNEVHFNIRNTSNEDIPVVVNAVLRDDQFIYWSIFSSIQRDKLNQELVETKHLLEAKAKDLQRLSVTDELTGMLNRRELRRRFDVIASANQRTWQPLSLLVMDIDRFKEINDQQGHAAGDAVLRRLGDFFREEGRESDVIARFGGDEFVFLLPNNSSREADAFARRLHKLIARIEIESVRVTVSIGIATADNPVSFDELFKQADHALYQAKNAGRDKTRISPGE